MKVGIVGAGRAGTAVAVLLQRAGHTITSVSGRGPTRDRASRFLPGVAVLDPAEVARISEVVVVAVPDDLIETVVEAIADADGFLPGQWVAHLSGATPLSALDRARSAGAGRLGVHPLQTFPDPAAGIDRIPGSLIALEADDEAGFFIAERLADDLMGVSFRLADERRALYHAAAVFASNYVVAATAVAEQLLAAAGVPDPASAMRPLQLATIENVASMGPAAALTGPAARGDAGTIERNLQALARELPWAVPPYIEMARVALDLAQRGSDLDADRRAAVEEVLARWS
ncbi:MAG TPA: Rossmann-like and DUF2520 domain-containing protein [Actinomycetota bacterium]